MGVKGVWWRVGFSTGDYGRRNGYRATPMLARHLNRNRPYRFGAQREKWKK